jgi:hypothetical protein
MDFYARLARSIGLLLLVASGGAHASELMRMPFDCRFDGAQVRLRPSEDRTYTVIGRREREVFTTCSPAEPDRCSSWLVHRFDFDCDGDRVAWIDAAAAATRFADWDAWIEDGRFRMRMDPLWGVARARPFRARRRLMRQRYLDPDAGDPYGRGEGDVYGARIVTVPPGFAPAVAIPLTFSGGAPEMAEAPDAPAPDAPAQEAPAVADDQSAPEAEPVPDLPERAPPQEPNLAATAPPPVVVPAPRAVTSSEAVSTEKSPAPSAPANETDAHAADATTASETPQGHTVINGPRPVPTEAASPAAPATTSAQSAIAAARIETSAVAPPVAIRPQPPAAPAAPSDTTLSAVATPVPAPSESATLPSIAMPALSMETAAAAAATMLALAGLAVFGFLRWRRRPQPAVLKRGDIGDISLGGGHKGLTYERAAAVPEAPADASPPGREASEGTSELPVPTTYAEALEVLGASPDSSTAAIKKIVDGLRQSWHPDLARSETDRLHREARVRQINVAWDLVSQRRSAA